MIIQQTAHFEYANYFQNVQWYRCMYYHDKCLHNAPNWEVQIWELPLNIWENGVLSIVF